ncbi:hypothetical protein NHX12_032540 [Muraenolepis orangiensis]|uniref:Uncharacterized protein n=1 Tax=Muraenolepis orangiensis TaxID=630683 RepID=A0A9Q0IIE4_9TELE|nr:hypothetical protein NHX12_032540 [Muraenolepis orangiensis]
MQRSIRTLSGPGGPVLQGKTMPAIAVASSKLLGAVSSQREKAIQQVMKIRGGGEQTGRRERKPHALLTLEVEEFIQELHHRRGVKSSGSRIPLEDRLQSQESGQHVESYLLDILKNWDR